MERSQPAGAVIELRAEFWRRGSSSTREPAWPPSSTPGSPTVRVSGRRRSCSTPVTGA